ncbi:hypothetical protein GTO27_03425 [Candidatus Bathyarchaeota archaeon]|nr:hypothetical protein [Candidatus Bathyarchaeota archaeon]
MNGKYWRQLDIFDPKKFRGQKVCIVGAGAIGSMTALILAKMGIEDIAVWDDDTVEEHNLPNQMYPLVAIGTKKVLALEKLIKDITGIQIKGITSKWKGNGFGEDVIVIVCTDNMASRKAVWEKVKLNAGVRLFIDARMGGELMRIYTVDPMRVSQGQKYEKTLYTDKQAEELACTKQSIIYNLAGISGFIANQIKKCLNGDGSNRNEFFNEIIFDYKCMILEKERWS